MVQGPKRKITQGVVTDQALSIVQNANANAVSVINTGTGTAISVTQAGAATSLDIQKTNTSSGPGINVANSGTGFGIIVSQVGNNSAMHIDQSGSDEAFSITQSTNNRAINVSKTNTGNSNVVLVTNSGTGNALLLTQVGAAVPFTIANAGGTHAFTLDNGNVGFGTASPANDLDISRTTAGGGVTASIQNQSNTANSYAHLRLFVGGASANDPYASFGNNVVNWALGLDNSDSDSFKISSSSALGSSDRVTIDTSGNVGIGTTSPGALLDVTQTANAVALNVSKTNTGAANVITITNSASASASSFDIQGNSSLWHFAANGRARIAVAGSAVKNALNGWATLSGPTKWQTVAMSSAQGAAALDNAYFGATFDGRYVYYAPSFSDTFISYDTQQPFTYISAWQQLAMSSGQNGAAVDNAYQSCIFDGRYLYFAAFNSDTFVRYDTSSFFTTTSSWKQIPMNSAQGAAALDQAYVGASFDGLYIYYVPFDSTTFIRYQTTQDFTAITSWSQVLATTALGGTATVAGGFENATFDGRYIYYAPKNSDTFVRFDTTGTFTSAASWEQIQMSSAQNGAAVDSAYAGAVFDGRHVYYGARDSDTFVRFDTTGSFTAVSSWAQMPMSSAQGAAALDAAYFSVSFDGRYIYYTPFDSDTFIRYDTTISFTSVTSWEQIAMSSAQGAAAVDSAYSGTAFDGRYIYHAAVNSDTFVRFAAMNSAPLGPTEYAQVST